MRVEGFSKIIASVLPSSGCERSSAALVGDAAIEHAPQLAARRRGRDRGNAAASPCWRLRHSGHCRATLLEDADRLVDMALVDDERRQQPHDVLAGADHEQPVLRAGASTISVLGTTHSRPMSRPLPRTSAKTSGYLRDQRRRAAGAAAPAMRSTPGRKSGASITSSTAFGHRHGQRVAAEGRAMRARRHADRGALGGQAGADREAAAQRLGDARARRACTPAHSWAKSLPVRPMPHCTSSIDQQQPELVGRSRAAPRDSLRARWRGRPRPAPARPGCRPSSSVTDRARISLRLPKATWSKPGAGGPKPLRYFSLPAAASVASVRPWKEPVQAMIR